MPLFLLIIIEISSGNFLESNLELHICSLTLYFEKIIVRLDFKKIMVRLGGLEPPTSGTTNQRSNQLSYNRTNIMLLE